MLHKCIGLLPDVTYTSPLTVTIYQLGREEQGSKGAKPTSRLTELATVLRPPSVGRETRWDAGSRSQRAVVRLDKGRASTPREGLGPVDGLEMTWHRYVWAAIRGQWRSTVVHSGQVNRR